MSDNIRKKVTQEQAVELLKEALGLSDQEAATLDQATLAAFADDLGIEMISAEEQPKEVAEAPAEEQAEEVAEAPAEEQAEEVAEAPAEEQAEEVAEAPAEEQAEEVAEAPAEEQTIAVAEQPAEEAKPAAKAEAFTLTPPANNEELMANMCTKRGRKLIYAPKEVIYENTFTVLGTDKKNEEGLKVKDVIDALIKSGDKLGYLQKYDGLKGSEIKEEYENDVVYEYAEQEFRKAGVIYDGGKIKVYVYDWDNKACHHVGYVDEVAAEGVIKYLTDKENYSFGLHAIITGGKGKKVTKDASGKVTVEKIKDGNVGLELDIDVLKRKD